MLELRYTDILSSHEDHCIHVPLSSPPSHRGGICECPATPVQPRTTKLLSKYVHAQIFYSSDVLFYIINRAFILNISHSGLDSGEITWYCKGSVLLSKIENFLTILWCCSCGSFFHGIPLTLINVPSCDLENETVTFRCTAKFHHVKVLHEKFLLFWGVGGLRVIWGNQIWNPKKTF